MPAAPATMKACNHYQTRYRQVDASIVVEASCVEFGSLHLQPWPKERARHCIRVQAALGILAGSTRP
jgi:hypothetical protein